MMCGGLRSAVTRTLRVALLNKVVREAQPPYRTTKEDTCRAVANDAPDS